MSDIPSDKVTWFRTRQLDARTWVIDDRGQDLIYLACAAILARAASSIGRTGCR